MEMYSISNHDFAGHGDVQDQGQFHKRCLFKRTLRLLIADTNRLINKISSTWRYCESKRHWGPETPLHIRGVWGLLRPPTGYRGKAPLGVQGAKPPEAKWITGRLIDIGKNCLSWEKFSLTSLKEHKAINLCGTFCFLKSFSRLLGLTVVYFDKNTQRQFSSFTKQFIFMFAKNLPRTY